MPSITGIELGPDSCVLVRARPRAEAIEVSALHRIEGSGWPAHDTALTATLRQVRKTRQLPRRARVVAWALSEPATEGDTLVRALVRPIVAAGFRVERVLTPPQALAELARTRPRGRGVAAVWLSVNVHGAAVAIVRDGTLLFGRTFEWNYSGDATGPRAELLQRYSLVAHLAPEVRRGMTLVRSAHGAIVEAAITCGDLPDLRSLTMPLIEELDLEVETLDSTEGLVATRRTLADGFAESAPAIRLATAAATIPPSKGRIAVIKRVAQVAAAVGIVAALGWFGYKYWIAPPVAPIGPRAAQPPRNVPAPTAGTAPARSQQARATIPAPSAPPPAAPSTTVARPAPPVDARTQSTPTRPDATKPSGPPPPPKPASQVTTPPPPASKPAPQVTTAPPPVAKPPVPQVTAPPAQPPARDSRESAATKPREAPQTVPRAEPPAVDPAPPRADTSRRKPVPLKAPVPSVESILVASDRRVAVIDGQIVTVGDQVGPRTVAGIEQDAVVLQEPSGYQIRIPIRRGRGVE